MTNDGGTHEVFSGDPFIPLGRRGLGLSGSGDPRAPDEHGAAQWHGGVEPQGALVIVAVLFGVHSLWATLTLGYCIIHAMSGIPPNSTEPVVFGFAFPSSSARSENPKRRISVTMYAACICVCV